MKPTQLEQIVSWNKGFVPQGMPLVVPYSGGLDSVTIASILSRCVSPSDIYALHISHDSQPGYETERALCTAQMLGINFLQLDIHELSEVFSKTMNGLLLPSNSLSVTQNASLIYAVSREIARSVSGLLVGTLDLSEILTGYFPKDCFVGDFLPTGGLLRSEVKEISSLLGLPEIPESYAMVEGCGNIVEYVNNQLYIQKPLTSEGELDCELKKIIRFQDLNSSLAELCRKMHHKGEFLLERPAFFSSPTFKRNIFRWFKASH